MTDPCPTCVNGMVPVSGRGGDGFDPCPDCASPQPDTAPEGPWTVVGNSVYANDDSAEIICNVAPDPDALARRVAAALNGAPATPAERAVPRTFERQSTCDACAEGIVPVTDSLDPESDAWLCRECANAEDVWLAERAVIDAAEEAEPLIARLAVTVDALRTERDAARADRVCWRETHNQVAAERDALRSVVRRYDAGYLPSAGGTIWFHPEPIWPHDPLTPAEADAIRRALASPTEGNPDRQETTR